MKRVLLFGFPVLFLLLHLFRFPLPLPAFLLPRRVVLAPGSDPQFVLAGLQRYRKLLLPAEGALLELRRADFPTPDTLAAYLREVRDLPAPDLAETLGHVASLLPPLSRLLLLTDRLPSAEEVRGIRRLQGSIGPAIAIRAAETPYDPLFMAYACTFSGQESQLAFDLQFARRVGRYRSLTVRRDGGARVNLRPAELSQGREYHASFALPAGGELTLELTLAGGGPEVSRTLRLRTPAPEELQVLLVTDKWPARNLLDTLYRVMGVLPSLQ